MKKFLNRFKRLFKTKKREFSKGVCAVTVAVFTIVALFSIIDFHRLQTLAIEMNAASMPTPEVPVRLIECVVVVILGYCGYQLGLKGSRNRYGIDETGVPYSERIKEIYESIKNENNESEDEISG